MQSHAPSRDPSDSRKIRQIQLVELLIKISLSPTPLERARRKSNWEIANSRNRVIRRARILSQMQICGRARRSSIYIYTRRRQINGSRGDVNKRIAPSHRSGRWRAKIAVPVCKVICVGLVAYICVRDGVGGHRSRKWESCEPADRRGRGLNNCGGRIAAGR